MVAPNFDGSTLEYVNKIRYFVDLIEVSRWSLEGDSWLLVNKLEALSAKRVKPVSGLITYDKAFYEENHNPQNVEGFMKLCGAMTRFAQERGWPVQPKFNKDYFCCKVGFFNAFGVFWESVRSYALFFKVPRSFAEQTKIPGREMFYDESYNQANFQLASDETDLSMFEPFFRKALDERMK